MHVYYQALYRYSALILGTVMGTAFFVPYLLVGLYTQHAEGNLGYVASVACAGLMLAVVFYFNWFAYEKTVNHLFTEALQLFSPAYFLPFSTWGPPPTEQHPLWKQRRMVIGVHWRYVRSAPAVQETFMQLLEDSGGEFDPELFDLAREVATPTLVAA